MTNPSSSSPSLSAKPPEGIWRRWGLTLNCICNVPMYTQLVSTGLYVGLLICARARSSIVLGTPLILYGAYLLWDDKHVRGQGWGFSRTTVEWLRHCPLYHWVAEYFPVRLHKTQNLPPHRPYILVYHPHGIIGMGCGTALLTNGCNFDQLFPGLYRVGVLLNLVYYFPFYRDWLVALGHISPNKDTIRRTLQAGTSVVIIMGGSSEALQAHASLFRVVAHRTGLFQLALETEAQLVPCLAFGENAVFKTLQVEPSSSLYYWQQRMTKWFSFSVPVLLNPIPQRVPIDIVVGPPVSIPPRPQEKEESTASSTASKPSSPDVASLQQAYWDTVKELYEQNKGKYRHADIPLELI